MTSPETAASIELRTVRATARDAWWDGNGGLTDAEVGTPQRKEKQAVKQPSGTELEGEVKKPRVRMVYTLLKPHKNN